MRFIIQVLFDILYKYLYLFVYRQKDGLFQGQISRYLSEFEEMCRLGKGSYGNVFKVFNFVFPTFQRNIFTKFK